MVQEIALLCEVEEVMCGVCACESAHEMTLRLGKRYVSKAVVGKPSSKPK